MVFANPPRQLAHKGLTHAGFGGGIEWNMGDGTAPVICTTAGTPYADHYGKQASPTCGHRYEKTSWDQPDHSFTVTASSYWVVTWSGGGQAGTISLDPLEQSVTILVCYAHALT